MEDIKELILIYKTKVVNIDIKINKLKTEKRTKRIDDEILVLISKKMTYEDVIKDLRNIVE